eukprot:Em0021g722a
MLRQVAADDKANWDKWVLLPTENSTGFSPFELLYGRSVPGPLDILKESWKEPKRCSENVVSYVLGVQDKLETMSEMVKDNLERAQQKQKLWYDQNARQRELKPGDLVLVLLPTSASSLTAHWKGPYPVLHRASSINYVVDMHDTRKRERTFHINMLKKWNTLIYGNYWADLKSAEDSEEDIPDWRGSEKGDPTVGKQLSEVQKFQLNRFSSDAFWPSGATAMFQWLMDKVLQGLEDYAAAYIDDLVIHSATWEEHLTQIQIVLQRLRSAGLMANPQTCQLGMSRCVYLGDVVGSGLVQPKRSKVMWTEKCEGSFQKLKSLLCVEPVLRSPDFTKEFLLQTDASDVGVSAVLSQLDEEVADLPVAYYSSKLLAKEQKYATIEKECLAIKLATQAFRVYLLRRPFIIQTDHRVLEWLDRLRENNAKLSRWSIALQPFKFEVRHRPGKDNGQRRLPFSTSDRMTSVEEKGRNVAD